MKIYYDNTGDVIYAVPDYKHYYFRHTTKRALSVLNIDETPGNKTLCHSLLRDVRRRDNNHRRKFRVIDGEVVTRQDFIDRDDR